MNEKLAKYKAKIKKHAPEITLAAAAVAATAYAIFVKSTAVTHDDCCHDPKMLRIAMNDCCMETIKTGEPITWQYENHTIDLAYDPNC